MSEKPLARHKTREASKFNSKHLFHITPRFGTNDAQQRDV